MEKTRLDVARIDKILIQICGSLHEAHGRGIVHRDLKPDNIVLCNRAGQTDWVEVLDFGIAKRSNEEDKNEAKLTQQGTVLGTPPYMSPEQFTGKPIDARSDIYSLGVMAYEMLTGRLPFNGNTAWEWASAHMTAPPAPIETTPQGPSLPAPMKAAINRALAKLPEERFATVSDFLAAFTGQGAAVAVAPAPEQAQVGRGKTEVGAPIAVPPGAFGAAGGAPPGSQVTPHAGNHAMPVSGGAVHGVPAAPPRERGGGGNKTPLLIAAGVIGLLSVGAIALAMRGGSSSQAGGIDLGGYEAGASAPHTDLSQHTAPSTAAVTPGPEHAVDAGHAPLAPLAEVTPPKPVAGGGGGGAKPAAKKDAGVAAGGTAGGAAGTAGAAGTPGGTVTPPPAAEPRACALARQMYGIGNKAAADKLAEQCRAQGGKM